MKKLLIYILFLSPMILYYSCSDSYGVDPDLDKKPFDKDTLVYSDTLQLTDSTYQVTVDTVFVIYDNNKVPHYDTLRTKYNITVPIKRGLLVTGRIVSIIGVESVTLDDDKKGPSEEWKISDYDAEISIDTNKAYPLLSMKLNLTSYPDFFPMSDMPKYIKDRYYTVQAIISNQNVLINDEIALNGSKNSDLYSKIGLKHVKNGSMTYLEGIDSPLYITFTKFKGNKSKDLHFELTCRIPLENGNIYELQLLIKAKLNN